MLEQRDVAAADRGRQPGVEVAIDSHRVSKRDHIVHAFHLADLHSGDVARVHQRRPRWDLAHAAVVEVVGNVAVEALGMVVENRRQRDLVIAQRGFVDVGLERRAGLALRQHHVKLAPDRIVAIIGRPDPCENLAVPWVRGEKG